MKNDYQSLIRYLRLKEGVSQELLSKKLGTTKSNLSRIENKKQNLIVDDLEKALNYLGAEIQVINKKGEDVMKKMKSELLKKEMRLTDVGYSKDFTDKNGNTIMVEFNLLSGNILVAKDMFDKEKYLSIKEYDLYEDKYTNEQGYGVFFETYIDDCDDNMWDVVGEHVVENNLIIISDKGRELFEDSTLKEIQEIFIELDK